MENYICINGKKAELTEEQLKALGIELPKANPFEKNPAKPYYWISGSGFVITGVDANDNTDNNRYDAANYCTDKSIMEQRALHETLNRLLWRYSMMHNKGDNYCWNGNNLHYRIYYSFLDRTFKVDCNDIHKIVGAIYFDSREIAQNAINEIVLPFMKAHPEFKL